MSSVKLPYQFETGPGHAVLTLEPGLNNVQWSEIERVGSDVLARVQESRPPAIIVDLSGMDYMGSAMVALLVRVWKTVKETGGKMAVVNRHADTLEVLRLAGLTKVWTIVTSREEAEAHLGVRRKAGTAAAAPAGPAAARSVTVPLVRGILLLLTAVVALGISFTSSPLIDRTLSRGAACVIAALALIVGTVVSLYGSGMKRGVGVFVVAAGLAVLMAGVMVLAGVDLGAPVVGPEPAAPLND